MNFYLVSTIIFIFFIFWSYNFTYENFLEPQFERGIYPNSGNIDSDNTPHNLKLKKCNHVSDTDQITDKTKALIKGIGMCCSEERSVPNPNTNTKYSLSNKNNIIKQGFVNYNGIGHSERGINIQAGITETDFYPSNLYLKKCKNNGNTMSFSDKYLNGEKCLDNNCCSSQKPQKIKKQKIKTKLPNKNTKPKIEKKNIKSNPLKKNSKKKQEEEEQSNTQTLSELPKFNPLTLIYS